MNSKPWWQSKTIWANALALLGTYVAPQLGVELKAEEQVAILVVVNLILRLVTKGAVDWNKAAAPMLLAALMLSPLSFTGCANPEQTAYRTLGTIGVTANTAHNVWTAYVARGGAKPEQIAMVRQLWASYCAAFSLACDAGKTASQSHDVSGLQIALNALTNCEADLISAVKQFLPTADAAILNGGN